MLLVKDITIQHRKLVFMGAVGLVCKFLGIDLVVDKALC